MADVTVAAGERGAYDKVLVAGTVYTIAFADDLDQVEVITSGSAALGVTVDAAAPSSATDPKAWHFPASVVSKRVLPSFPGGSTVVRLISAGTPTISVGRVSK